jgi:hypothetical protein
MPSRLQSLTVLPIVDDSRNSFNELAHLTPGKWTGVALAMIAVAFIVNYERDSQRHSPAAPIEKRARVTAIASPLPELKTGKGEISTLTAKARDAKAREDNSIRPSATSSGIDGSVAGQPVSISSSLRESCKSEFIECPLVMASVAKMAQEPRDNDWASKTEELLQAAADTQGPGKYLVRNVECRSSICILEVELHVPEIYPFRYEGAITSNLSPYTLTIAATEYDSLGERFIVEFKVFSRRQN